MAAHKVVCNCLYCGVAFEIYHSQFIRGDGKFCSRSCFYSYAKPTIDTLLSQCIIVWPTACWERARQFGQPYERMKLNGVEDFIHRHTYREFIGPILDGHEVHHVCENKRCCNPAHLVLKTRGEHNKCHANSLSTINAGKTHCPQGHEYDEGNTYISSEGYRRCRICGGIRARKYYRRYSTGQDIVMVGVRANSHG